MTGDYNGDGRTDLAVVDSAGIEVLLGNGDGDGTFQTAKTAAAGAYGTTVTGDFNGDGRTDLAVAAGGIELLPGQR